MKSITVIALGFASVAILFSLLATKYTIWREREMRYCRPHDGNLKKRQKTTKKIVLLQLQ
jgi:hypothetical protein